MYFWKLITPPGMYLAQRRAAENPKAITHTRTHPETQRSRFKPDKLENSMC